MKKIILFVFFLCLASIFQCITNNVINYRKIEKAKNIKLRKKKFKIAGMGIGNIEDPNNMRRWYSSRLVNPETKKIPANIRSKEISFSKNIPSNTSLIESWIERGPYNVGGRTRAMVIDTRDENIIIAGGVSGGLWRSENLGESWDKLTDPEMLHNVTSLKQDIRENHNDTWYYGTGEAYGNSASGNDAYFFGNGIYKTTDNGLTWNSLTSTASNSPEEFDDIWDLIWDIEIDHTVENLDVVYAASYGAIHRSINGGETWSLELGSESNSSYFTELEITQDGVIYATLSSDGEDKGIWRSEDGENWYNITPNNWPLIYDRIKMAVNPQNENELYFIAVTPGEGQSSVTFSDEIEHCSLWKYTFSENNTSNQMGEWENKSEFIPSGMEMKFDNFYAQGSYNLTIAVSPINEDHIFIGGTNLYLSTDGFSSSQNTNQIGGYQKGTDFPDFQIHENHHPDQHEIAFLSSSPTTLINANDGGIFLTDNYLEEEVSWNSMNNGYYTTQLYNVSFNEKKVSNSLIGGFQDNGNFYTNSSDPNSPWVMPINGDGAFAYITEEEDIYYMSIQRGKVYKLTIDENGNRLNHRRIDPIGADESLFIHPFVVDPVTENIMYYPNESIIWRHSSLDNIELTNEWDSISMGWSEAIDLELSNREISSISITKTNPENRLYVGTNKQQLYRIDEADSNNPIITNITCIYQPGMGMTSGDFFHASAYINNIAVHPENGDIAMAVFSNYGVYSLYITSNGGETWQRAGGNLEEQTNGQGSGPSCRWASIMPFGEETLYFVATSTGLYATNQIQGEQTLWTKMGKNSIGNVVCEQVKTRSVDSLIVVATHGNGIYSSKIESSEEVLESQDFTSKSLFNIYPNPAQNEITIISQSHKMYNLYSVKGELIENKLLLNRKTKIDVSSLPKGMYVIEVDGKSKKWFKN